MKKTILILAALAGAMFWTGCMKLEDDIAPKEEPATGLPEGFVWLSLQASKGVDTKALALDGNTLNAYWANTEKVTVFKSGSATSIGTLDVSPAPGSRPTSATLAGPISGASSGDVLTLLFPRAEWDYTGQVGTLASIESSYDYALASVTVNTVNETTVTTTGGASFENEQSIYRFRFLSGSSPLLVKGFTISSPYNNKLVRSRSWSTDAWTSTFGTVSVNAASATSDPLYIALRNEYTGTVDDIYSFDVIGDDDALYVGYIGVPKELLNGKFISAQNVNVSQATLTTASATTTEVW